MHSVILFTLYVIAIFPLGFYYGPVKCYFGGGAWFVIAAAAYLLVCSLIIRTIYHGLFGKGEVDEKMD
jgi:hypothetical protein